MSRPKKFLAATLLLSLFAILAFSIGWPLSSHPTQEADLGELRTQADLEAVLLEPGSIEVESVLGASWEVDRSGLINLDHPKAKAAGLEDGLEPIGIYFHAVRHPTKGLFIIDSGVESEQRDAPDKALIRGMLGKVMHADKLVVKQDTEGWLTAQKQPLAGVFLTHLHLDHVSGMRDVPRGTPIYAGPGEVSVRAGLHVFVKPVIDEALAGHEPIREWQYQRLAGDTFTSVIDVFGDGSFWALWVPGHTSGSTAYLARTAKGPVMYVGDACHTTWGWNNGVEPGTYTHDGPTGVASLAKLKAFADKYPQIEVKLGHQQLQPNASDTTAKTARH